MPYIIKPTTVANINPRIIPTTIAAVPVNKASKNPMIIIVIKAYNNFSNLLYQFSLNSSYNHNSEVC